MKRFLNYYRPGGAHHRKVYNSAFGVWLRELTQLRRLAFQAAVFAAIGVYAYILFSMART